MARALPVLHHFLHSHFNEKARWALDWKGVRHVRRSYLPGPHLAQIRRLSGQTETPVLELEGALVAGSARIVAALEERFPERPLLPADPEARRLALAIEEEFDREVGPAVRTALFSVLLEEPGYLCRIFSAGKSAPLRALYRAAFPLVRSPMARANGVTGAEAVARAFARSEQALDEVAKRAATGAGPLAGGGFGVAELACASLLALLVDPDHPDMAYPQPMPGRMQAFLARFAPHPGARWVLGQYAQHRPAPCAVPAPA
jgi:glutathione S-transferase